jgi:hypothetical protein
VLNSFSFAAGAIAGRRTAASHAARRLVVERSALPGIGTSGPPRDASIIVIASAHTALGAACA